jgi:hypothetical protein
MCSGDSLDDTGLTLGPLLLHCSLEESRVLGKTRLMDDHLFFLGADYESDEAVGMEHRGVVCQHLILAWAVVDLCWVGV